MTDQPYLHLSVLDPIGRAFDRTKRVLFAPFNIGKWFGLGFCAFLANLLEGGGSGNFGNWGGKWGGGGGPRQAADWVQANLGLVIALAAGISIVGIALGALFVWLQSRGKFMFIDGVARNHGAVSLPWHRFRHLGNSLFGFTMLLSVLGVLSLVLWLAVGIAIAWPDIMADRFDNAAITGLALGGGLLACTVVVLGVIGVLLNDFVVPAMYLHEVRVGEAWSLVRQELLASRFWTIVLYFLMRFILAIPIAIIALIVALMTCCLAALPYIGTVILLPLFVFTRCYSLYFIEQYGARWRFFDLEDWPPRCVRCDYDLRASPGPHCPECGTEIPLDQQTMIAAQGAPPSNDPPAPPAGG